MAQRRQRPREGDWFAVPLPAGGFGVGLIARAAPKTPFFLGYFFGPKQLTLPTESEVMALTPTAAILIRWTGDIGFRIGRWPLVYHQDSWRREAWPMPRFCRQDAVTGDTALVRYSEEDLIEIGAEPSDEVLAQTCPRDGLSGHLALEIELETKLSHRPSNGHVPPVSTTGGRERVIDHYFYFHGKREAMALECTLRDRGYRTKLRRSVDSKEWLVLASHHPVPPESEMPMLETTMERLALSYNGRYDGWEKDVEH
jgi:hypothetical protein